MAEAMTTASRTSGVAPLAVHFDAVASGSGVVQPELIGGRREYADLFYTWGFDDPNSGTWSKTDGASRNSAKGYCVWHVFEDPGEYTVALRVKELDGTITDYEQTITVTDPDTVFSANTYYVDSEDGDDGNPGTLAEPFETFAAAMAQASSACRILFRRGRTYPATATGDITAAGPGSIGAYGTGIDPEITQATDAESAFELADAAADWRIADLVVTGPGATSTGKGINHAHDTLLCLNLTVSGFKQGFYANYTAGIYDPDDNLHDHVCIADCDFSDNGTASGGSNGIWWGGTRFGLLGSYCDNTNTEHHVRLWHAQKSVISHNELTNATDGKHALKLHNHYAITNLPDGQYNVVSDNVGSGGPTTFALGPQSDSYDETVRDCLVERNLTIGDATTAKGIWCGGPYMTAQNNVFVDSYASGYACGIGINKGANGPAVDGCRAVNNTTYANHTKWTIGVRVWNGSDIIASNNLASNAGSGSADAVRVDGGSVTQQTNYDNCPGSELTDPDNGGFTLVDGSSAIGGGTTLAYVREDRAGNLRPQSNTYDIGAYEFVAVQAAGSATGFLTAVLVNLKETVAQSVAFQTWVDADTAAEARARIHPWGLTKSEILTTNRPYALVSLGETRLSKTAGGARSHYGVSGRPGILFFNDVNTSQDEEEQLDTFTEAFEAILLDIAQNTGPLGYYDFAEAEIDPPRLGKDDDHPDEPLCIQASVWFPYAGGVME